MLKINFKAFAVLTLITAIKAEVFFEENFDDDTWKASWIYSKHPGKDFGEFVRSSGSFFNDASDKGIQTSQDARFYAISRKFNPFTNEGKPLVIQFSVKHEQDIDCGGGYIKLFDCALQQTDMHGESPYEIMFGPDICGPGTKKVHVIFSYKGKNHLINKDIRCKDDVYTHFYTLVINPDNTYEVLIDNEKVESGNLEDDWDFLLPKKIKDPNAQKPSDWDDRQTIDDPEDKKPEDWDQPELIRDPDATKPEDWDDEMDGEWEAPMIHNPDYKGEWQPKQLDNPNYKGAWEHPSIDNPEYSPDPNLYLRKELCTIGFDLWQVKSGTIFDNVLITDDIEYASKVSASVKHTQDGEKKMKEEIEAEHRKKEEDEKSQKEEEEEVNGQEDGREDIPEENEEDASNEHDEL